MFSPEAWGDGGGMLQMLQNNPNEFKNYMRTHLASMGIDDVQFKVSKPTFDENANVVTPGGEIIGIEMKSTSNIDYTNPNAKPVVLALDEFVAGDYSLDNIHSKLYEVIGGSGYQKKYKLGTTDFITSSNAPSTNSKKIKTLEDKIRAIEQADPLLRMSKAGELQKLRAELRRLNPKIIDFNKGTIEY